MTTVTIDAKGKPLGRLATSVADALRGKNTPIFRADRLPSIQVTVINAAQVKITGSKLIQKNYYSFSGYPGGLKTRMMRDEMAKDPAIVIRHAVRGMLPSNKLRPRMLKHLIITS